MNADSEVPAKRRRLNADHPSPCGLDIAETTGTAENYHLEEHWGSHYEITTGTSADNRVGGKDENGSLGTFELPTCGTGLHPSDLVCFGMVCTSLKSFSK